MPTPLVALAWGSTSARRTELPLIARAALRFTAVVVFPTPPFCLTMAMTRPIASPRLRNRFPEKGECAGDKTRRHRGDRARAGVGVSRETADHLAEMFHVKRRSRQTSRRSAAWLEGSR